MMHIFSLTPTFAIEDIDSNVLEKQDIANIPVLIDTENKKCEDNTKEEEIKQKDTEQKENPGASNEVSDTTVNEITEKNNSSVEKEPISDSSNLEEVYPNIKNEETDKVKNVSYENNLELITTYNSSENTTLGALGFYSKNISLDDKFSPDVKEYTATVSGNDTTFRIYGYCIAASSSLSTINLYFNNELIAEGVKGMPDKTFTLKKGENNQLKIEVVAENGNKDSYIVNVKRAGSSDTALNSLAFYSGNVTLDKTFNSSVKDYIGKVKGVDTSIRTNQYGGNRVETRDPYAVIDVYFNDDLIFEDVRTVPQKTFDLVKGISNVMKIVVKAENGDQEVYTLTLEREGYDNTSLNSIAFYSGNVILDKPFNPEIKDYIGAVRAGDTSVSTNQYGGNRIETKDPYSTINLYFNDELIFENVKTVPQKRFDLVKDSENIMKIVVTAESGRQDTYTVSFKREGYNDTALNSIAFYSGNVTLNNSFSPEVKNYIATLKEGDTSFKTNQYGPNRIEVRDPYATIDIYFNKELIFENVKTVPQKTFELLKGMTNVMEIVVTAENGDKGAYTLTFKRELDSSANIKDVVIDKGSLDVVEDTINATMYSWQDIALSSLILEDSWADYKAILNDNKEIEVNESFDLDKGDNKLEIEVISNNGTKKVYPLTFERSDSTSPTISYTVDNNKWTNKDVLISINSIDDSGIRYIELPNGDKIYSDKAEFYAGQNGSYTFKVYDDFLNESIEVVDINNIDTILPELNITASTTELTNNGVDILIEATDNIDIDYIVLPDGSITKEKNPKYTAKKDGVYKVKAVDISGNETEKQISLNNIDSENPILSIEMSTTSWTNKDLTLNISAMSDKGIKCITLPDGNKVENSTAKYVVNENGTYLISTESLGGNVTTEEIVINNIDREAPKVQIEPSTTKLTNKNVSISIVASDNSGINYIILPNGEKIEEAKYNYSVATNGKYTFTIVDLAGNKSTKSIEIKNIDKNPPVIENKNDVINIDYDTITLDLSSISSSSGIHKVILPNGEEIINPKEDKITYKVKYNDTYTFKIIDKAGNSTNVKIEASNLKDKYELPDTSGLLSHILSISIISLLYGTVITFKNNNK